MKKTCTLCGSPLSGSGIKHAKLCPRCWATLLIRLESGERGVDLAKEYGVTQGTICNKAARYLDKDYDYYE